jgi:hypothetical protein
MAGKVVFSGVVLHGFSRGLELGSAHFSADWTPEMAQVMGWSAIPSFVGDCHLDGVIESVTTTRLAPEDRSMHGKHTVELSAGTVNRFRRARRGEESRVHFAVEFSDLEGASKLERYLMVCGTLRGMLTVLFRCQVVLPEVFATDEQRQRVLKEA